MESTRRCRWHLEKDCQLRCGLKSTLCDGEDKCISYQVDSRRECKICHQKGSECIGYSNTGGPKYLCWNCSETWTGEPVITPVKSGYCRRCGLPFTDPRPVVVNNSGNPEIACVDYCPDCNAEVMFYILRQSSAYRTKKIVPKTESC